VRRRRPGHGGRAAGAGAGRRKTRSPRNGTRNLPGARGVSSSTASPRACNGATALPWLPLAATALRRTTADRALALAAFALLLASTTLLTTGTLYADAVALGGVRTAIADAAPTDRRLTVRIAATSDTLAELDGAVAAAGQAVLDAAGGGDVTPIVASESLIVGAREEHRLTVLATRPGIEAHATLAEGRWPADAAGPFEAVVSTRAADALGLRVGDVIDVTPPSTTSVVTVRIVGRWEPDAADPYWAGTDLDLAGSLARGGFTTAGPLVVASGAALAAALPRVALEWRIAPQVEAIRVEAIDDLAARVAAFPAVLRASLPVGIQARVETDLPRILASVDRSVLVSRSGVLVLVLEFAVVAAYAVVLVAGLLTDRRRTHAALVRSRGASAAQMGWLALVEAVALAGAAALVAPAVSLGVVRLLGSSGPLAASGVVDTIQLTPGAIVADLLTAAAGVLAMTLPALGGGPIASVRAAIARQGGRTLAQRLGVDLALVVAAGVALWQLRLYGAPITRNARGVLGVDPLLVAAPAIGLLAGAVLATRFVPRLAELGEPLLSRGRGLVGSLGGRALARRPLRSTRAALLLMLAAALGTFASAHVATWTRSQADQAAYRVGADIRWAPSGDAPVPAVIATRLAAADGIRAAAGSSRQNLDAGRSVRGATALAIDAAAAPAVLAPGPAGDPDAAARAGLLADLAAARPSPGGLPLPDGTGAIAVTLDTALEALPPENVRTPAAVRFAVVVADAGGWLHRVDSTDTAPLVGTGSRLVADLAGAGVAGPGVRLRAVEIAFEIHDNATFIVGRITVAGLDATAGAGGARVPLDGLLDPSTAWAAREPTFGGTPGGFHPIEVGPDATVVLGTEVSDPVGPAYAGSGLAIRATPAPVEPSTLAAIAGQRFLELTAARVGDTIPVTLDGRRTSVRIVGSATTFPSLDPAQAFLIVDGPSASEARWDATYTTSDPEEWWIAASDRDAALAELAALDPGATALVRETVARTLSEDPVALGVIGVLGLGSLAAMVFAAIGFLVSATVSTSERSGELALLRALGLSRRQVAAWLSIEHAFLLVVGLGTGIALGALLAWLVLPFATLTGTGAAPVPPPVVTVPADGLVPIVVLAAVVFAGTLAVLRVQLAAVHVGDVLRARDE
jgi:hypothetical protein